jgi:hypothetical protein
MKFVHGPESSPFWQIPWHPLYTPFSEAELIKLSQVDLSTSDRLLEKTAMPSWVHPEDPLNRIQCYNFWDVLRATLISQVKFVADKSCDPCDAVDSFMDAISQTTESILDRVENSAATFGSIIYSVISELKFDPDFRARLGSRDRKKLDMELQTGEIFIFMLRVSFDLLVRIEMHLSSELILNRSSFAVA